MDKETVGELFMCVMQHMKCIEVRLEFTKALLSQKQKYALAQSQKKVEVAINHLCGLLPDSDTVLKIKKDLDKSELVYVMLLTEKFSQLTAEELEEVDVLLESYINNKRALKPQE
jgi:hypothetical protein